MRIRRHLNNKFGLKKITVPNVSIYKVCSKHCGRGYVVAGRQYFSSTSYNCISSEEEFPPIMHHLYQNHITGEDKLV